MKLYSTHVSVRQMKEQHDEMKHSVKRRKKKIRNKDLGSGEVLKVFMIGDDINRSTRAFEVVSPDTEGFKDS